MKLNDEKQTCRNCKYYTVHFAKNNSGFYNVVGCGHCINRNLPLRESHKIIRYERFCPQWQPMKIQLAERKNNLLENINLLCERLTELILILQDDLQEPRLNDEIKDK